MRICKLGRGHQCDIRISDISVSRFHAFMKYSDNVFKIVDNNSKFGTLVKLGYLLFYIFSYDYPITKEKIAI